jgi:hypothetical protein
MKPWERWTFNLASLLVVVTGAAYFWMKYLLQAPDPFSVVNHPVQGPMLAAHVLTAPAFILIGGIVLNSHVLRKLSASRIPNRKTGLTSLATFALMIGSGYLLQVVTSDSALRMLVAVHVATGAVFAVAYTSHLIISTRLVRRQAAGMREVA